MTSIRHTLAADDLILATLFFRFVIDAPIFTYNHLIAGKKIYKKCHLVIEKRKYHEFNCNRIFTVHENLNDFQFNEV